MKIKINNKIQKIRKKNKNSNKIQKLRLNNNKKRVNNRKSQKALHQRSLLEREEDVHNNHNFLPKENMMNLKEENKMNLLEKNVKHLPEIFTKTIYIVQIQLKENMMTFTKTIIKIQG